MKKCVLMLGAGLMQKPAIQAIKELGFSSVVIDKNENAICRPQADRFFAIDLKDTKGILHLAQKLYDAGGLSGCFTAGTDFSSNVAEVTTKFNLAGHPLVACNASCNKGKMRQAFKKGGAPQPNFILASRADEITQDTIKKNNLQFPCVIKPVDNMGARGCKLALNLQEIKNALPTAIKNSRTGQAIIEDYMAGREFSLDAIVYNDVIIITGFATRHIYFSPYFVELGHTMPVEVTQQKDKMQKSTSTGAGYGCQIDDCYLTPDEYKDIISTFVKGIKALGLCSGAAKGDIKLTKYGAKVGEIAARLSGGYMSGWTFPYSSGLYLTKELVKIATNTFKKEDLSLLISKSKQIDNNIYDFVCKKASAERAWISIPGVIKQIIGLDVAKNIAGIKDVLPRACVGDCVVFPCNNVEKCGNVISECDTIQDAIKSAQNAISEIVPVLCDTQKTKDFLLSPVIYKEDAQTQIGFCPNAFDLPRHTIRKLQGLCKLEILPKNMPVSKTLPPKILNIIQKTTIKDYNYRTLQKSIYLFDALRPAHQNLPLNTFIKYLIKGGIQGILFLCDSVASV